MEGSLLWEALNDGLQVITTVNKGLSLFKIDSKSKTTDITESGKSVSQEVANLCGIYVLNNFFSINGALEVGVTYKDDIKLNIEDIEP